MACIPITKQVKIYKAKGQKRHGKTEEEMERFIYDVGAG
jgi:hypothetical protein